MTYKFTPGPWKAGINGVVKAGRYNVCPVVTAGGSSKGMIDERDVINANACLIAAAPDLLEACKAMIEADGFEEQIYAQTMMIEAIAKATNPQKEGK